MCDDIWHDPPMDVRVCVVFKLFFSGVTALVVLVFFSTLSVGIFGALKMQDHPSVEFFGSTTSGLLTSLKVS